MNILFMCGVVQDIIDDDEIKLDWFFKASMINDLVNVSVGISHGYAIVSLIYMLRFSILNVLIH